jgi:AcrR family transcriptional regulator
MVIDRTLQLPSLRARLRDQTRRELALAALELASSRGIANLRVPDIAAAAGVSPRTFNNYFSSKEAAIAWPATLRAERAALSLMARPQEEALSTAIFAALLESHEQSGSDALPSGWLERFRTLVGQEPALLGEYLKASDAGERALAEAIRARTGAAEDDLRSKVLAAMVVSAERAAVRHWLQHRDKPGRLLETVREALLIALKEVDG